MDDFGLLVGQYFATLPTLTDTEKSELVLDSNGRLIISGRFLEDSAHTSGDAGLHILAVRNDSDSSLVDADGDYAPLQVDATGKLKVAAQIDITFDYDEDTPHTSGDTGAYVLAVRQDTLAPSTDADGDYSSFKVNADGELYVADSEARTSLAAIAVDIAAIEAELLDQGTTLDAIETELLDQGTTLDSIETEIIDQGTTLDAIETELLDQGTTLDSIDTEIQSITHDEDSAHTSGDAGVMSLAVRADADGSLVDTDGDYAPLQVDANGKLKVVAESDAPGSESYTVTDDLAAGGDGLETITAAGTPWVTVASLAVGAGQTAFLYGYQWACDQNAQFRIVTDDTVDTVYYKTGVNSSAQPGSSEHFSEGGRIEIPGAANLEVRLEIKKRITPGGNANGTGSLHLRVI